MVEIAQCGARSEESVRSENSKRGVTSLSTEYRVQIINEERIGTLVKLPADAELTSRTFPQSES